jgi:hypothetical protein
MSVFLYYVKILFIVSIFSFISSVYADEKSIAAGKKLWAKKIGCGYCHGVFGDGSGDPRSPGAGANLRITQLDREGLIEVIACGIPGSEMPYFHRSAYKKPEICWDMIAEDMGEDMPKTFEGKTLSSKSIPKVVDYILANIKDRGPITLEECENYFKVGSRACNGYK